MELTNEQVYAIYDLNSWWHSRSSQVFEISGGAGTGKALDDDTLIPTPSGFKRNGDLHQGDSVFNEKGEEVRIIGIYDQGFIDAYELTFSNGEKIICNDEHIWPIYRNQQKDYTNLPLKDFMGEINNEEVRISIPRNKCVDYPKGNQDDSEYLRLGKRLFDYNRPSLLTKDDFMVSRFQREWIVKGFLSHVMLTPNNEVYANGYRYHKTFVNIIADDNIHPYLASIHKDDDIHYVLDIHVSIHEDGKSYLSSNWEHFKLLLESLGYPVITDESKDEYAIKFILTDEVIDELFPEGTLKEDCREVAIKQDFYTSTIELTHVKKLDEKRHMHCIYVDTPSHLYLASHYLVTHNTTLIRYFIESLNIKYEDVLFVAFMGKAANQMARNGLPAKTIHSAIYECEETYVYDEKGKIVKKENGRPKTKISFRLKEKLPENIKLIVVDEASMVETKMAKDLLSFNIPVIALGDLNQLPPVFGNSYFLKNPNVRLTQIMRQEEDNPIIWLSQQVLEGKPLKPGVYGRSFDIKKEDLTEYHFRSQDIILTGTNRLRYNINNFIRSEIKGIEKLEYPHVGEKVICRKNNWGLQVDGNIYLTNGTTGYVDKIYKSSFNGKTFKIDFKPDFTKESFKKIEFDYKHMYAIPGKEEPSSVDLYKYGIEKFEYAYAITVFSSQGSQWPSVLYLHEDFMFDPEDKKKLMYTAITRASDTIGIVL